MGVAQKRGEPLRAGKSWLEELSESKREMGLDKGLLDARSGLKKYPNRVVKLRGQKPLAYRDLVGTGE